MVDAGKDLNATNAKLAEAVAAEHQAQQREKEAAESLVREAERVLEMDAARKRKDDLERFAAVLEAASTSAEALEAAIMADQTAQVALQTSGLRLDLLRKSRSERDSELKSARTAANRRSQLVQTHASLLVQRKAAEDYERAVAAVELAKAEFDKVRKASTEAAVHETNARAVFVASEQALAAVQALHLATKLEHDQPCPVCGSTDHPRPATGDIENVGRDQAFREARDELEKAEAAARQMNERLAGQRAKIEAFEQSLSLLERQSDALVVIQDKVREIEADIDVLGPSVNLEEAEASIDTLDREIAAIELEIDHLRTKAENSRHISTEARVEHEGKLYSIPESLRTQSAIASELADVSLLLDSLVEAKKIAEAQAQAAREAWVLAVATSKAAGKAVAASNDRFEKANKAFATRLADQGLSAELFQNLKPAIAMIEADIESVREFQTQLNEAQGAAKAATLAIGDLTRLDLPTLKQASESAAAALSKSTEERIAANNRVDQLEHLRKSLEEAMRKVAEAEAESGPLRKIAALANGENSLNLKLETYAIGAMFDRVLEAANLRLGPMTSSRYQLERDREGGRGSRGLGIQVFDAHTGKFRGTDTLSGGETFIAALALALGLADVVEATNGKVRLDTIFIDEGFGSLDTENGSGTLDQVLNVLGSLVKQSRAVGLISHVPLVQEAIPNGFYVRKGPMGSAIEKRGEL